MKKVLCLLSVFLFFGCATSIRINVTKPAEVNMAGARKIAVLDVNYSESGVIDLGSLFDKPLISILFGNSHREQINQDVTKYTTNNITMSLLNTGYFTIVGARELSEYFGEGKDINPLSIGSKSGAEAIIVSDITLMDYNDDDFYEKEQVYNSVTETTDEVSVRYFKRTVEFSLSYRVLNTKNGNLLASRQFNESQFHKVKYENKDNIKSEVSLFQTCVDNIMPLIAKQLAPYVVAEYRYLLKDETKDPAMERADELVQGSLYKEAFDIFIDIWGKNQNPAAGYNAAIMQEAMGLAQEAHDLMKEVGVKTGSKEAMREHQRLKTVLQEIAEVEAQMKE
ncbi:MAG: hypothetical protein GY760_06910 [Deltaproteobacteria bacterium]|nr:hypothetical protein [Deltaproteobacteria bacterium]